MTQAAPELIELGNGVRVALDPMPGLETAAIGVWIGVGARMEQASENGIAHLFEHMAFKGAGTRDAQAFAEAMEDVGGVMNAATSYDRTCYYARVTSEHTALALELIADIVRLPHWRADDLEKEKSVVAQERGEAFDQPDDRVFELHQALLFPDQPLGRPILGEEATLAPVTPATLAAFRDLHMSPSRLVVAAAGGFERDALVDLAKARFGDASAFTPTTVEAARPASGAVCEARKLEQSHLTFSWDAPGLGHSDIYAARLLCEIFGGGMASRLFQEVREKRGLVYAIDSWLDTAEDYGRLGVYAGCSPGQVDAVASASRGILESLAADGPTDRELRRAKAVVGAQMLMGAESPMARCEARAGQVFLHNRLDPFSVVRAKIGAVTLEQVQAVAQRAAASLAAAALIGPRARPVALAALTT